MFGHPKCGNHYFKLNDPLDSAEMANSVNIFLTILGAVRITIKVVKADVSDLSLRVI